MAGEGRVHGRVSLDGQRYEFVQAGVVRQSRPIDDARADKKLQAAIIRNKWEVLA